MSQPHNLPDYDGDLVSIEEDGDRFKLVMWEADGEPHVLLSYSPWKKVSAMSQHIRGGTMNISKEKELAQRRRLRRLEQQRQNRCLDRLLTEMDEEQAFWDRIRQA